MASQGARRLGGPSRRLTSPRPTLSRRGSSCVAWTDLHLDAGAVAVPCGARPTTETRGRRETRRSLFYFHSLALRLCWFSTSSWRATKYNASSAIAQSARSEMNDPRLEKIFAARGFPVDSPHSPWVRVTAPPSRRPRSRRPRRHTASTRELGHVLSQIRYSWACMHPKMIACGHASC